MLNTKDSDTHFMIHVTLKEERSKEDLSNNLMDNFLDNLESKMESDNSYHSSEGTSALMMRMEEIGLLIGLLTLATLKCLSSS